MIVPLTDEEKRVVEDLIGKLEIATGELQVQDRRLSGTVGRMIEGLSGLRSQLGLVKRKAATP